jgi:hypothetical protein
MTNPEKYVILEGIEYGNRFFCLNTHGVDHTRLATGEVAYRVLGYAATVAQAQIFLYGYSSTTCTD